MIVVTTGIIMAVSVISVRLVAVMIVVVLVACGVTGRVVHEIKRVFEWPGVVYFVRRGACAGLSRTVPDLIRDPVLVSQSLLGNTPLDRKAFEERRAIFLFAPRSTPSDTTPRRKRDVFGAN